MGRAGIDFYQRDVLKVCPDLLGKEIVLNSEGHLKRFLITEVEAYRGEEDKACHASKGRTLRTEIMYHPGGSLYVYLIYGMYWMLNIVTGEENNPQAALIRGVQGISGPGRLTRKLEIDKSYYGESLLNSNRIWLEDNQHQIKIKYQQTKRIGIDYAGKEWSEKPWRFILTC